MTETNSMGLTVPPPCHEGDCGADVPGATPREMKASGCWRPLFVVKPRTRSRYKLLVDCLDELSIIGAKYYALGSWTVQDSLILKGNAALQASNQRIVTH